MHSSWWQWIAGIASGFVLWFFPVFLTLKTRKWAFLALALIPFAATLGMIFYAETTGTLKMVLVPVTSQVGLIASLVLAFIITGKDRQG